MLLNACAKPQAPQPIIDKIEVKVPVAQMPEPPAEILDWQYKKPLPQFLPPADKMASSCLSADGEANLRALLLDRQNHLQSWKGWATQP